MKQGTTPTLEFKLDINIDNVTKVYFTFTDELKYKGTSEDETASYLLQKNYPDDATFEDDTFKLPLTQEETDLLTNTFFVEAQVICGTAVVKSDVKKINMPHTLWTTYVDDNESDGQSEVIHLSFSDYVRVEGGGGSDNYNDLTNKPRINNIELVGNKTTSDLGLDIETGDGLKRVGNEISVDLIDNSGLMFINEQLTLNYGELGTNEFLRQILASTQVNYALASKDYVDNLLDDKQDVIDDSNKLYIDYIENSSTKGIPTISQMASWSAKQDALSEGAGISLNDNYVTVRLVPNTLLETDRSGALLVSGISIANDTDFKNALADYVYTKTQIDTELADKQDKTDISTDTTSTTVSLTLADNHEYRYTQELTSLTLTMPSGDFISSVVFASGSTPTQITYDSSIKWSGDDVTNGQFVPSADKDYDLCFYYNGLNINGIVRSA